MSQKVKPGDVCIPLAEAAARCGAEQDELIVAAANGEIALAAWAHGHFALPGARSPLDNRFHPEEGSAPRLLANEWIFLESGFARNFLHADENESLETGIYSNEPKQAANLWVQPKPRLRRQDLYVLAADVQKLIAANEAKSEVLDSERFEHDRGMQVRANQAARAFIEEKKRKPTKSDVAKRLKSQYPDEYKTLSVTTIARRIRADWDHT